MQIIELLGLPGCGKSTLLSEIFTENGSIVQYDDYNNYIKTISGAGKIKLCIGFMLGHPGMLKLFLNISNAKLSKTLKTYWSSVSFLSKLKSFLNCAEKPVVLDQGVLQYIGTTMVRLALGDYDKEKISKMTSYFVKLWSFKAVYLNIPKEIANERAKRRAQTFSYDTLPDSKREEIYNFLDWCNSKIAEAVPSERFFTINSSDSGSFNVENAEMLFRKILRETD